MRVTAAALQRILNAIDGDVNYMAVDAGTPTEAGAINEVYRNTIVPMLRDGNTTILEHYIDETQTIATIGGFVLLAGATATPGTGAVYAFESTTDTKAYGESLTVSVEITVVEAVT